MLQTISLGWPAFPEPAGVIPFGKAKPTLPTRILISFPPVDQILLADLTAKETQRFLVKFAHALVDGRMRTALEYQ
jgi:hypothetical protein